MSLQPVNTEQVQSTCQVLLAYLDDPENRTPNHMLEGIVSAKSLMRAVIAGELFICGQTTGEGPRQEPTPPEPDEEVDLDLDAA